MVCVSVPNGPVMRPCSRRASATATSVATAPVNSVPSTAFRISAGRSRVSAITRRLPTVVGHEGAGVVVELGAGVKDVKVDLPKKEVTVVYDSTKNSDDNIVKGFASIKVKAEPKKADTKK